MNDVRAATRTFQPTQIPEPPLARFLLPHAAFWSWGITLGELAVGLGMIFGCLTGIAAFFGWFDERQ